MIFQSEAYLSWFFFILYDPFPVSGLGQIQQQHFLVFSVVVELTGLLNFLPIEVVEEGLGEGSHEVGGVDVVVSSQAMRPLPASRPLTEPRPRQLDDISGHHLPDGGSLVLRRLILQELRWDLVIQMQVLVSLLQNIFEQFLRNISIYPYIQSFFNED